MPDQPSSDLDAFAQIVREHEGSVRAFLTARLDDPFEAHDLAQEVFMIAWKQIDDLDLDRPLRPWLLSVAANLIRKHHRKNRATPIGGNDVVLEYLNERASKSEDAQLQGPVFDALDLCMNELDEGPRRLIEMRYAEGMSIRDIGNAVGGKHSAITMKLHRLRSMLFDCIQGKTREETALV